jgi:hypothetical protein
MKQKTVPGLLIQPLHNLSHSESAWSLPVSKHRLATLLFQHSKSYRMSTAVQYGKCPHPLITIVL